MNTRREPDQMYFVQWIRVGLIILVVAHHAAQPYGLTGGSWPVDDSLSSELFRPFFALNAAYFMGFFFLLAGYFVEGSYDRRGGAAFVTSRLLRLGLPLVVLVVVVFGGVSYADSDSRAGYMSYLATEYLGKGQLEFGPLWFIAHLLIYQLIYTLWRTLPRNDTNHKEGLPPPGLGRITAFAVALGSVNAFVCIHFPQDRWITLLGLIPVEPAHLPQYLALFLLGIIASRGRWFIKLDKKTAYRSFWIGATAFVLAMTLSSGKTGGQMPVNTAVLWGFLEAFVCVGMITGLLVFFRQHLSSPGRVLQHVGGAVYGIYLIHVFNVVGLQIVLRDSTLSVYAKFSLVTVGALLISFVSVFILRKLPLLRSVI